MSKFKEYRELSLPLIHKDVLHYWKKNNIFNQSIENKKESKNFTFYEGPPSANGMPGIHHVIARTIKDLFCRYKLFTAAYISIEFFSKLSKFVILSALKSTADAPLTEK